MSEVMNAEVFESLKQMMGTRFDRLVETYLRNGQASVEAIRCGYDEGDVQKIEQAAHPLKGSSAGMGAVAVEALAGEIETWAVNAQAGDADIAPMTALIHALEAAFEEVDQLMRAASSA